jgi:hypothetical protein
MVSIFLNLGLINFLDRSIFSLTRPG